MKKIMTAALAWTAGAGPAGLAAFVGLYVLACVAFLPGSVLTLGAGAAFGLWKGFLLVSAGSTLGACASFLVGRYLLRDWVSKRMEKVPAFAAVAGAVGQEGWKVVFLTRLSPVLPFNLLNYGYGLTGVGLGEYALASWIGMMPGTFLYVYLGAAAGEAARGGSRARTPAEWALYAGGLAATAVAAWLVGRTAKRALSAKVPVGQKEN
ncbi:MAG: TVP38/TMEM64 family protein [Elusimicrobia bacterium]|nr:TVP38/TMEM64 family protein [Elusimicrobiota bacterium]